MEAVHWGPDGGRKLDEWGARMFDAGRTREEDRRGVRSQGEGFPRRLGWRVDGLARVGRCLVVVQVVESTLF